MCTIGAVTIDGHAVLFKNRDKLSYEEEIVEKIGSTIIIKSKEGNVAAGLNTCGVAFVRAEVVSVEVIKLAYEGKIKEAIGKIERKVHPTSLISSYIEEMKSVEDVIMLLQRCQEKLQASILVIADKRRIIAVEMYDHNINVIEVQDNIIRTNHFHSLPFGPKAYEDYPSSFEREHIAKKAIANVKTIVQVQEMLASHDHENRDFCVCRHGVSSTISSTIIDGTGSIWYYNSSPCKKKFDKYVL